MTEPSEEYHYNERLINNYQYHYDNGNTNLLKIYKEKILERFPSVNEFYLKFGYLLK